MRSWCAIGFVWWLACSTGSSPADSAAVDLSPSQARLAERDADVALLTDVARCAECHRDAAAQHAASAHARSSFDNPWYRAVVDRVRAEVGVEASRHCAGCHDPVMLVAGAMDAPIEPDDPLTLAGVTCLVCHGIVETRADGNASYTLSTASVPIPDPNVPAEVAAHRARLSPAPLRTPGLCASCHRGFLGTHTGGTTHLFGLDEAGAWRGSAWGDQHAQRLDDVAAVDCRGCHMPPEPLRSASGVPTEHLAASHRFAGGHGPLGALDPDQARAIEARQRSAATLDVTALVHADGTRDLPIEEGAVVPRGVSSSPTGPTSRRRRICACAATRGARSRSSTTRSRTSSFVGRPAPRSPSTRTWSGATCDPPTSGPSERWSRRALGAPTPPTVGGGRSAASAIVMAPTSATTSCSSAPRRRSG
ncbi:MAG: hypothetical protein KF901_11655 [Myxococcales bacterium]|nr:hypothetical protein [Myxococcales bacterium]